jgi:hypothetical protein
MMEIVLGLTAVLLVGMAWFVLSASPTGSTELASQACRNEAMVSTHATFTLHQHQNWIDPPEDFRGGSYVVVNVRTGESHTQAEWSYRLGRIYVPTRYALLHPSWGGEPWRLLYNC